MPQTKLQKAVFSVLMAVVMVYAMELYNLAWQAGGLHNGLFLEVLPDLLPISLIVILLQSFIGGPLAQKLAFRLVKPGKDKPIFITLAVSACTVCLMCPMMSAVATVLFQHPGSQFLAVWLQTVARNFPMAFCWQIFFAGPLVRFVFRQIFAGQLTAAPVQQQARERG